MDDAAKNLEPLIGARVPRRGGGAGPHGIEGIGRRGGGGGGGGGDIDGGGGGRVDRVDSEAEHC